MDNAAPTETRDNRAIKQTLEDNRVLEPIWIAVFAILAVTATILLFPRAGGAVSRWSKGLFYLSALVAILSWTLLKSCFVLGGRRLFGR